MREAIAVCLALAGGVGIWSVVVAADTVPPSGYRLQESDDILQPLQPVRPRSAEVQNKVEAAAWFATGRLLETRQDFRGALNAYRKAVELDPRSIEIYRALVPLAMQMDQVEEALRLAMRAVELDPQDYELLLRIGVQFARQRDFAAAIKYLDQAVRSPRLDQRSPAFVMLHVELGVLYHATGQADKAADSYAVIFDAVKDPSKYNLEFRARAALLADPRTSYERIGQVLMDGGRLELASEALDLAAKTNRASAGNLTYARAKILLLSNKPEAALAELQKYFDEQRQSKGREAYQLLADILQKLGRGEELVGRLEQIAQRDPRNRPLQYFFADALVQAGELERARQVYEAALKGAGDAAGYLGLAGVYRRLKRADELLDALGRGLSKVGPDGVEQLGQFDTELKTIAADAALVDALMEAGRNQAKAEPPQLTFDESYLLAKVAEQLERYDQAIEFFRLAAKLDKDRAILAYRDLADVLIDARRYAEAATVYEDALRLRPPIELKARFYLGLTQAKELAGDTDGALAAVEEAQREFPQLPVFQFQHAWIYYHARQFDKAIEGFEKVIRDYPQAREIVRRCQFSLSNIHVLRGEIRKGEEILEKILEEDPEDPAVNNDLGYLYADQGKHLEKAEVMIRKAVKAEPENAAYLDSLGWVLFKLGRVEEAVPYLEKAANMPSPGSDGTIWDHLGDCYHRQGKLEQAIDAWKKALQQAEAEKHPDVKLIERIKTKLQPVKADQAPPAADNP
jgi:tetratricopeptide (TPR) repeat protein